MNKLISGMFWLNEKLKKAEMFSGCLCLGVLFVVMIVNAMLRYCLNSGIDCSDELNQFLFVWLGFLAAAYTMGDDKHLNVTAFICFIPKTIQYVLKQIMNVIMLVFFVMYVPELLQLLGQLAISNVMRVPLKYVYAVLPVSFGLMSYHIVCNMISDTQYMFKGREEAR